jgi:putative membrane protein
LYEGGSDIGMVATRLNNSFSLQAYTMGPWSWGWEFSMGWLFLIIMAAFWIAVTLAIIFLIRWLAISASRKGRVSELEDSAMETLRMRYAKGEINKEEFQEKKRELQYR